MGNASCKTVKPFSEVPDVTLFAWFTVNRWAHAYIEGGPVLQLLSLNINYDSLHWKENNFVMTPLHNFLFLWFVCFNSNLKDKNLFLVLIYKITSWENSAHPHASAFQIPAFPSGAGWTLFKPIWRKCGWNLQSRESENQSELQTLPCLLSWQVPLQFWRNPPFGCIRSTQEGTAQESGAAASCSKRVIVVQAKKNSSRDTKAHDAVPDYHGTGWNLPGVQIILHPSASELLTPSLLWPCSSKVLDVLWVWKSVLNQCCSAPLSLYGVCGSLYATGKFLLQLRCSWWLLSAWGFWCRGPWCLLGQISTAQMCLGISPHLYLTCGWAWEPIGAFQWNSQGHQIGKNSWTFFLCIIK